MKRETAALIMLTVGLAAFVLCLIIHAVQIVRLRQRVELLEWIEKPMPVPTVRWPTNIAFDVQGEWTDTSNKPGRREWKTK